MGLKDKSASIYIIDFGLCKKYFDQVNQLHIEYHQGKSMIGTARYASVNAHLGIEQSRRDDVESLCYMLIYLAKSNLPWMNQPAKNKKEKYEKIMHSKLTLKPDQLCVGLPYEFAQMLTYCKALKFEDAPDYDYLKKLFIGLSGKQDVSEMKMDWDTCVIS